jgi:hypothetical protein
VFGRRTRSWYCCLGRHAFVFIHVLHSQVELCVIVESRM